jgi:dTDP-4-dehydrorhamnose reductase
MKVLVTGAAGMLGSALVPALARRGHAVIATDLETSVPHPWGPRGPRVGGLDVRSFDDVHDAVQLLAPELLVHLAAATDLEDCELDPDGAAATNAVGTQNCALAAQRADIPLVYISTAGVFNGAKPEPYTEYDDPDPINHYGRTKLAGERIVRALVDRHLIVRAGWMVGGGRERDHKFVRLILDQLDDGANTIHAVGDKLGTPTYAVDFAECFLGLLESERWGLYHMSGTGACSRYDIAALILRLLDREDVTLVEVGSEFFAGRFFAPRPYSEVMRNLALELHGLNLMTKWEDAIERYLAASFSQRLARAAV